jgi:hypothetical protein
LWSIDKGIRRKGLLVLVLLLLQADDGPG